MFIQYNKEQIIEDYRIEEIDTTTLLAYWRGEDPEFNSDDELIVRVGKGGGGFWVETYVEAAPLELILFMCNRIEAKLNAGNG